MHRASMAHVLGIVHAHVPLAGWGRRATPVTPTNGRGCFVKRLCALLGASVAAALSLKPASATVGGVVPIVIAAFLDMWETTVTPLPAVKMATGVITECATEQIDALVTLDLVKIHLGRAQSHRVLKAV